MTDSGQLKSLDRSSLIVCGYNFLPKNPFM